VLAKKQKSNLLLFEGFAGFKATPWYLSVFMIAKTLER